MCYRAADFVPFEAARDLIDLANLGWLAHERSRHILAIVDPIDDGNAGIEMRQHPTVLLAQHPELALLIDEFVIGARRDVCSSDYATRSNFQIEATRIMRAAASREQDRELERLRNGETDA